MISYFRFFPVFLICVALLGCEKKSTNKTNQGVQDSSAAKQDEFIGGYAADQLTLVLGSDPETLDPAKMSGEPEGKIAFNIFEGLLTLGPTTEGLSDPKDLLRFGVAESFNVSDDGRVYTFKLRDNAKWSDGKPVTAQDFVYSWKRILTPGFPADYVAFLKFIKGADAFQKGETTDFNTVGVKAIDPHTLEITLENPTPYFPEMVAFYTFFPVRQDIVEKYGDDWTRPEHIISNGPYKLVSYQPQKDILLEKSDQYWDKDNVQVDKAKFRILSDPNAVVNAYRTGELHATGHGLPMAQITSLITHPDYSRTPYLGTYYFRINVKKDSPLKDPKVRQALSLSVDRKALTDNTLNGVYQPATSIVPEMADWKLADRNGYQIKKAKELLSEAGYPNGKGFPELTFLYNTDENHKLIAESLQDMWKRNLGINIKLVNKEWKTYLQDIETLNYDIARAGWIGDYNDPTTFLEIWESDNGNNNTGWDDKEYDSLLKAARVESSPQKRIELLKKAEEILNERGPIIPLYYYTQNVLVSKALKGYQPHNRGTHLIKYMSLAK